MNEVNFETIVRRKAEKRVNRRIDNFMRSLSETDSELVVYVPVGLIRENFSKYKEELIRQEVINLYHEILGD